MIKTTSPDDIIFDSIRLQELPVSDFEGWGGRGRIALVGDAAHAMRPASGQGGSMAFEDALMMCRLFCQATTFSSTAPVCTAQGLREVLKSSKSMEILREFENSRIPRVRAVQYIV